MSAIIIEDIQQVQFLEIPAYSLAPSAGKLVDYKLQLWDVLEGKQDGCISSQIEIKSIALSPDGRFLALLSKSPFVVKSSDNGDFFAGPSIGGVVEIWDTTNKVIVHSLHHGSIANSVNWSPSGKSFAVNCIGETQIWNTKSGTKIYTIKGKGLTLETIYSPSRRFIACVGEHARVQLWDLVNGNLRHDFLASDKVEFKANSVRFSRNDQYLAIGTYDYDTDKSIYLWDVETGALLYTIKAHPRETAGLDFSYDGKLLISHGFGNTVRLWRASDGSRVSVLKCNVYKIAYSPNKPLVAIIQGAITQGTEVCLWNTDDLSLCSVTSSSNNKFNPNIDSLPYTKFDEDELDIRFGFAPLDIQWSNDGDRLFVQAARGVAVYEVRTREKSTNHHSMKNTSHLSEVRNVVRLDTPQKSPFQEISSKVFPRYRMRIVIASQKQKEYVILLYNALLKRYYRSNTLSNGLNARFLEQCKIPNDLTSWEASSMIEIFKSTSDFKNDLSILQVAVQALQDWRANIKPNWQDTHMVLFVFQEAMTWLMENYVYIKEEISDEIIEGKRLKKR